MMRRGAMGRWLVPPVGVGIDVSPVPVSIDGIVFVVTVLIGSPAGMPSPILAALIHPVVAKVMIVAALDS